eukprot:g15812.t1
MSRPAAADQVARSGGASPAGPGGFADNDPSSIQHQRRKKRHVPTPSTLLRAALQADSEQGLMEVLGRCGKEYLMIAARLLVSVLMRKWGYTLFAGYKKLQSEECYGEHVLTNGKANKNSILPIGSLLKHYILIRKMDDALVAARRKAANAAATSKKVPTAVVIRGPKKITRPSRTTSSSAEVKLSCIPLVVVENETTKTMQEGEGAPGGKNYSANNSCNYLSEESSLRRNKMLAAGASTRPGATTRALVTTSRARAAEGARTSSASNLPPLSLEDYDFIQRYRDQLTDGEKARVGFWFREFWQAPTGEREMRDSRWRCKSYLEIVLHFKPLWHTCVLPGEDAVPVAQKLKPGALVGLVALPESALGAVEVENRGKFGARRGGEMVRTNSSSRMEARAVGGPKENDKTGSSAENGNSSAVAGGTDSLSTSPQDEPQEKISQVEPDPEVQTEKITVRGRNDLIRLLLETYVDTNGDGTEFVLEVAEASKYNNRSEDTSAVRTQQHANPICLRELLKTYDGFFASAAAGPEKLQTWVASAILMGELDTGGLRLQPSTVKRVTTILASHVQQFGGLRTDQQVRHLTTFLRGCLETSKVSLASNMMAQNLERLMHLVFALPKTAAENMSFANPGQVGAAGMFGGHTPFGAGVERNVREHTLSGVSQYFVTTSSSTRFLASCVAMVPQLQDDPGVPAGASTQGDALKENNGKTIVVGIKTYRLFLENLFARSVEDFSMKIFHLYIGRIALNERRKMGKFGLYGRQFREKLFRWTTAQLDRYGNYTTTGAGSGRGGAGGPSTTPTKVLALLREDQAPAIGLDDFHADVIPTSKYAASFFAEVIVGYCAPAQIGKIWLQMVDLFESWEFVEATWAFLAAEDTQEHLHFAADWKRPLDRHYVGAFEDEARSSGDPEVASLRQVVFDRVALQLEREMAVSDSHRAGLDPTTYARVMGRLRGYHPALFAEKFGAKPYVRWGQRAERPPGRASGWDTNVDIRPLSALTSDDLKQLPAAQITGRFCAAEKYFCAVLREHFPKIAKLKQKDDFQLVTNWLTLLPPHVFLCPEVVDKMSSILYARWSAKPQLQRLCHVFLVKTVIAGLLQAQFFLAELFGGAAEAFMAAVDTDKKIRFLLSHFDRIARFTLKCGNFDLASTAPAAASGFGGQHPQFSTTTKAQFLATKVFVPEWKTGGSYQHGSGLTGTGTAPVKLPSDDILLLLLFPLIKANARKAVDVVDMLHALSIDEVKHEGAARLFYALLEGDGSAAGPGGGSAGGDRVDAAEPKTPSASSVPLRGEEVGGRAAAGSSILSPSFVDLGRELDVSSVATRQLDVGGGGAATSGGAWDLLGGGDGHDHEDEQDTGGLEGEDTAGAVAAPLEPAAVVAPAAAFSEVGLSPKFLTRFEQLKVMRSCKFGFFHAYSSYLDRDECVEADFSFWAELEEEALTGTSSSAPAPAPPGTEVDGEPDLAFLRRFGAQGLAVFEDFLRAATPAQLVDLLENDARKFFRKAATKLILEQWNPICPVGQEDDLLALITKVLPELLPGCLPVLLDRLENAVFTPISSALNAEERAFHEERQQTAVRIAKAALNELKELPNSAEFVLAPAKWWVYLNPLKIIDNFAHKFGARSSSSGASACSATTASSSDSGVVGEVDSENDVEDEIQNTSDAHDDGTSPKSIDSLILTLLHHGAVIDPRKLLELPVIQPTVGGNNFSVTHANLFTAVTEQTTLSQLKVNCFGVLQPGTQLRLLKTWESNAEMYVNILAKCVPRMADQIDGFFYEIFDLLERISTYTSLFNLGDGASTQEILKSGWNKIVYTLLTSLRDRVRVDENVLHSEEQLVLFGCLSGQGKKLDSTNTTVLSDFLDAKYVDKKHIFALVHYVLSPAADFSKTIREAALRALLRLEQNDRDTLIQTLLERAGKDKLPLEVLFALCVTQLHDDNPSKPLIVAQLQRLEDGEWDTLVEQIADANPSKPDAYMHTAPRSLGDHFADRFLLRYLRGFLSQNHTTKAALSMPSRAWAQKWCKNTGGSTTIAGTSAGRKHYSVEEQKTAKLKKYTHDGRIFWLFVACERKDRIAGVLLSLLKRQLHSLTEEWLRALAPTVAKVDPVSGAKGEQQNVILSVEEVADYVHFIPHKVWAQTQQSRTDVSDYRQWLFAQIVAGGTRHMLKTKINSESTSTMSSTAALGVAYEELVCDRLAVVIDYWKKGSANGGAIDLKQQLLTVINHTLDREKLVRIAEDFHSEAVLRILEGPHAEIKTSSEQGGTTAMSGKQGQGTSKSSKPKAVVVGSASTLKHSLFLQMPLTRALLKRQLFEVNDRGCWLAFFQQSFAVYGSHLGSGAPILDFLEPAASRGVDKNRGQEDGFAFSGKAPDLAERGFSELLECLPEVFDLFPACSDPAKAAVAKLQKASVVDAGNQTWRAQRMATRKAGLVAEEKMGTVGGGKKNTGSCFEEEEEFVLVTEDASSPPSTSTFLAYSAYSHAKQPTTRHHFQPLQKSEIERLGSTGAVAKTLLTWVAPTTALPLFGVQLLKAKPTFARTLTDAEFSLLDLKSALVGSILFGRTEEENWPLCRQLLCLQNGYLSAQRALPLALALLKRTNESGDVERLRELYLMKRDQVVTVSGHLHLVS